MNINRTEFELLARYLAGESSTKEITDIEKRFKKDPSFLNLFQRLQSVWNARINSSGTYDTVEGWERLCRQMDDLEGRIVTGSKVKKSKKTSIQHIGHNNLSLFLRVAAILLIAGVTSLFLYVYLDNSQSENSPFMKEVVTVRGQRSNVSLMDGTHITLNSQSRVYYLEEFEKDARTVYLEGEAFFSIAHENRPFYVFVNGIKVQVLGTEFNVRSYNKEVVEVTVADGLVSVQYVDSSDEHIIYLEKGDMVYMPADRSIAPNLHRNVDLNRHIGWLEFYFVFEDTPLVEIAGILELSYGVDVEFSDPALKKMRLSAEFDGDNIYEVLQVIELVLDLEVEKSGRKVVFLKK